MRDPFSVVLKDAGPQRASVAAYFRGAGLSHSEVEDLLSRLPTCFIECEEAEAHTWAKDLSALGADVTVTATQPWSLHEDRPKGDVDHHDVVLLSPGPSKLQAIQAIREIANCDLRDASLLLDRAPSLLLRSVPLEEAQRAQQRLRELEVESEVRPSNRGEAP